MDLTDRIVLVPGASRPVGRAIARRFANAGARLVLPIFHDWPESTIDLEHDFSQAGFNFRIHRCDLTNGDDIAALGDSITAQEHRLDVLVNNIERGGMPIIHGAYERKINHRQWHLELETTLSAKWLLFRQCLPLLKKSGHGSVVNISSIAGTIGRSGPASPLFSDGYSAANRAITSFTEQWAREAAPNVRVNEVMIGLIHGRHGERTRGWQALSEDQRRALIHHTLLQRIGNEDEVADAVYFLAVAGTYVTGSVLRVDGGYCLGGAPVEPLPPGELPD